MYKIINRKKMLATMFLDLIGGCFFYLPRLFSSSKSEPIDKVKEILVIRTAYIGDVVMTLPLLKPLKEKFPDSRISFLTSKSSAALLRNNPYVDEVIEYDAFWFYGTGIGRWIEFIRMIRKRKFDLVMEARADIRDLAFIVFLCKARYKISYDVGGGAYFLSHVVPYSGLTHKVDYHLGLARYLGCKVENTDSGIILEESERQKRKALLQSKGVGGKYIAIHPGSRLFLKRWPLDRCVRLYDRLIETYKMPVILLGSKEEVPIVDKIQSRMGQNAISMAGQTELRTMLAIIEKASVFICNDSAPMHLSAAMKTPTIAIFGPSKSVETGPYKVRCKVVEKNMPCRNTCDESHCRYERYHACMLDISVDDVFEAVKEMIENSNS